MSSGISNPLSLRPLYTPWAVGSLPAKILAHQVEHALERVADDFDSLGPGPKPRHVDVRIAHDSNVELLQKGLERFQLSVCLPERGVETGLIAFFKRCEVDRLERRFQLLLAFRLSIFI